MVAPLKVKILYVFILLQVLTSVYALANPWYFFCNKSGSTGPAVTRLELQKVAYINSFLTIDLRITVSQHHCPSFTISSKYILHINF